jgi:hypothetical protein
VAEVSRGPIPDKAPDRPTVPEVAAMLRDYYRLPGRGVGGAVHIVVDDGNCDQGSADYCARHAAEWAREWSGSPEHADLDVRLARMLAQMTGTQRRRLAAMDFYE